MAGRVVGRKDAASDLVGRTSLKKGDRSDVSESAARTGDRHARQGDREERDDAGQREACRRRREGCDEHAHRAPADNPAGKCRAHHAAATEERGHGAVSCGAASEVE